MGTIVNIPYSDTREANGSTKTWTAPCSGKFKFEVWGASSGKTSNTSLSSGKGSYTSGLLPIDKDSTIYAYIGGAGANELSGSAAGGWNGGGTGGTHTTEKTGAGGGGATDFRTASGVWDNIISLRSRIIVSAGGAGGLSYSDGRLGVGGGTIHGIDGLDRITGRAISTGATQITGGVACYNPNDEARGVDGSFGVGGRSGSYGGGSSGGYYGGGGGCNAPSAIADIGSSEGNGSSGSSFISGHKGCVAVLSSSNTSPRKSSSNTTCTESIASTDIKCSEHYSGYIFTSTVMKAGNESMPAPSGGNETGHSGNGYARITIVE